jgi:hypothetical protein
MTAVVRDGRVANPVLPRRTDRGDSKVGIETSAQPRVGGLASQAGTVRRRLDAHGTVVDDYHRQFRRPSDHHDRVAAAALAGDGKAAAGEGVVDALGKRTLADHRKLRRRRQRTADERAERKDERRARIERVEVCATLIKQQPHAQAAAADELAQHRFGYRDPLNAPRRNVDAKVAAVITERHATLLRRPKG